MSYTATLSLDEALLRALAAALSETPGFDDLPVDIFESAPGAWRLTVYFPEEPDARAIDRLRALAAETAEAAPAIEVAHLADADWVAKSLAGLRPVRAGRFLVHGAHDRGRRQVNDIGIEIEAGQAFGTGHHGTTAGCLATIDELGKARRFRNLLDLGTGSGVLAIGLAKRFRAAVLASDIDLVAVKVAAENARANGVQRYVTTVTAAGLGRDLFARRGPFDLIVANILAGPLVGLSPALARHLAPAGVVVLSGLLPNQRARIVAAYRGQGLALTRGLLRDGWLTLVFGSRPLRTGSRPGRRAPARPGRSHRSRASHRRA